MKKQFLFPTLFLLAVFAGMNSSYGQTTATATHNSAPEASPACTNDALHPMAGVPYTYSVTTSPGGGNYTWWATTNQTFVTGGVLQNSGSGLLTSPDVVSTVAADYNTSTTASSIELTWGTDVLGAAYGTSGTPTFVAVHYDNSVSGCSDNLKVYQIDPVNGFIVDVLSLDPATKAADATTPYAYNPTQCFDEVQSAAWSSTGMTYDYGTNVLYFEVVAANFSKEWTPTFQITGLETGQVAKIEWDYTNAFTSPVTVTSAASNATSYTSPSAAATSVTNTSTGVSIYVKVTVDHKTYEGLADQTITLGVTGENIANERDVLASDCTTAATFADNSSTQTLTARPEVIDNTDDGVFE